MNVAGTWKSVRIKSEVLSQIDQAVNSIKIRNMQKYDSLADFVEKACIMLLEKENGKLEIVQR